MLEHWDLVQLDLHERFGIDTGDRDLMRARPLSWLRLRIQGLLGGDSRLARKLQPGR